MQNLLLISEYEKELDAIKKKYDLLFEVADTELVQKRKDLDTLYNKVHMNKLLAEAMTQIQNTAWSLEMTEGMHFYNKNLNNNDGNCNYICFTRTTLQSIC